MGEQLSANITLWRFAPLIKFKENNINTSHSNSSNVLKAKILPITTVKLLLLAPKKPVLITLLTSCLACQAQLVMLLSTNKPKKSEPSPHHTPTFHTLSLTVSTTTPSKTPPVATF